ncbi:DUF5979 domain-containing protein [Pseudobutyrivibrio xylanivorans]|uniref:DUF5979 domain-containing protein n=1 Tax=Pseudobutyrivibrio xylanivorans TaxID=185007 RepID=A0A5P6VML8_PSEXY|nr:DUF5979 domain-containing protein [Pseudobutyrivibrio xylanivorans]QFJ53608.1 hypothetical protein FXF36_01350 [Pseudobutyrivibrio xylanivorans]
MVKRKSIIAAVLVAVLAVSGFGVYRTQAAGKIDENKQCTVTVKNPISGYAGVIEVNFYKVADMDSTGQFKTTGVLTDEQLKSLNNATAETQNELAKDAYEALNLGKENAASPTKVLSFDMSNSSQVTNNIDRAMYLCVPQTAFDTTTQYNFEYYLVSVPSSNYIQSTKVDESGNIVSDSDDSWNYNVELLLKSKASQRFGKLEIAKTLKTFNQSLGTASFVFEVEGVDESGKTILSNVYTMNFDSAKTDSIVIDNIPAGTVCHVTEVYSGASYTEVAVPVENASEEGVTIIADDTVSVEFVNDYDNRLEVGGVSVENHFEKSGETEFKWKGSNAN